jgi:capsular exopolysaccharide synthesis family protein
MDPSETPLAPESRLHFLDYWRIIRIRKVIIIAVFFITTFIATFVTFLMRPQFSSTAQIKIEPDMVSDVSTFNGGPGTYAPYDAYFMETESKVIMGDVVLNRVVDALNLNTVWGKKYSPDGQPLKTSDSMEYLRRFVGLDVDRNTKLIDISVMNEDKQLASDIANSVAQSYKDYRSEQHEDRMTNGIAKLEEDYEIEDAKIQLMQSNVDQLRDVLKINDTDASADGASPTLSSGTMQHDNELYIEGQADYTKLASQMASLVALQATNPIELRDVLPTVSPDDELSDMLKQLHDNQLKLDTETNYIGSANPDLRATVSSINTLNEEIDSRVNGIMFALQNKVEAQKAALDELNDQVKNAETNDMDEAIRGQPYWEAKQVLLSQRDLHKMLAAKIESERADLSIPQSGLVEVISPATPGLYPVRPNKALNISFGAFFGLLVGLGLAFFIEYLDTSVKTIDEVERVFQAPVLGVIPQNVGILMDQGMDSSHAEAYRVLRTNILFSRKDENYNSIVVISAGMGEGKSTTVLNLATVFAQAGQRTLVVDSDLRRPTLHKLLRLNNNIGMINYLLKQNTLEEVIQTTPVPGLDFMSSGKLPGGQINILGSEQMKSLISELKQRYDFILFDSPPIMGLSDASVLASEIDMAIQIIQYRRYPQLMNIRAKQMVEKVGGNLVGIVLNNINMAQDESYYYYGGYYYHQSEDAKSDSSKGDSGDSGRVGIQRKY